ncbi:hypothetical protein Tco_0446509 [Tanacetum coccineum]
MLKTVLKHKVQTYVGKSLEILLAEGRLYKLIDTLQRKQCFPDDMLDLLPQIEEDIKTLNDDLEHKEQAAKISILRKFPVYDDATMTDFDPKDGTSSDDGDFEDIEYVSLEEANDVDQEEKEFDLDDILQIQDVTLTTVKLFDINLDSFFEKSDTSLSHLDNSLPEFETFSDHTEETSCGEYTTLV